MDDSTILIVGANGQLGQALQAKYPGARCTDSTELDISDPVAVANFDWDKVRVILNAAAFTNVDGAETPEGRIAAWKVNASAVGNLVKAALAHDLTIVHISTDYVFDGTQAPHAEAEAFSPLSVYGQSKAAGDVTVGTLPKYYILRTSWVIGEGKNFVRVMLGLGEKGVSPTVVADQRGRLTFTSELVRAIDHLVSSQAAFGTYNVSNGGDVASWAEITRALFTEAGYELTVSDTTTAEYFSGKKNIAPRPLESAFDLSKLTATGFEPKDWREDLREYIEKEQHS